MLGDDLDALFADRLLRVTDGRGCSVRERGTTATADYDQRQQAGRPVWTDPYAQPGLL